MRLGGGQARWEQARPSLAVGLVASIVAHWVLASSLPAHVRTLSEEQLLRDGAVPASSTGVVSGEVGIARHERTETLPGGSTSAHNLDATSDGRGGDAEGAYDVLFLVSELSPITLVDAPLNAADRSQVQRIDTARDRASTEDRRATPHPADDPFLATGEGTHRERREAAARDAQDGARWAPTATTAGEAHAGLGERGGSGATDGAGSASAGAEAATLTESGGSRGAALGAEQASPGRGIVAGRGTAESSRAAVATGRPTLDPSAAATLSDRTGRVRDDVDAELLAASLFESRADASRRAGSRAGDGRGGAPGGAGEGSGAEGTGGSASAYGPGRGAFAALDTSDSRYRDWLRAQRRRIDAHLVFPTERQLARDQGTSVVRLVVRRDGSIATAPRVIRSSGFHDLDDAALLAVRESLPFAPIPADLAVGREQLAVTFPIEFANPMVR